MQPVKYEGAIAAIVKAYDGRPEADKVATYWADNEVAPVRKVVKDHYIAEQQQLCCYCRHPIETNNHAVWEGEHIISRESKPQFMFEPRNLSISCKDCNRSKSSKNVLKNKGRKKFPSNSSDYIIVHPHFDVYDDYILWFGPIVAAASSKSKKGSLLIEMCDLTRYGKQCGNLKGKIFDQRFRKRIGDLLLSRDQQEGEEVLAELALQIKKLPKKA